MLRVNAAGRSDWVPAGPGLPLVAGDGLLSDPGGRAAMSLGGIRIAMDEATGLRFARLDPAGVDVSLDQGRIIVVVHVHPPGGIRIDTAAGRFELLTPGVFRAAALGPGGFAFAALQGHARLVGNRAAIVVSPGQEAIISADQTALSMATAGLTPLDSWSGALAAAPPALVAPPVYDAQPWIAAPAPEFIPVPGPIIVYPPRRRDEHRDMARHELREHGEWQGRREWREGRDHHAPPALPAPQMAVRTTPVIPPHPVPAPIRPSTSPPTAPHAVAMPPPPRPGKVGPPGPPR